jgi:hypothetical protein
MAQLIDPELESKTNEILNSEEGRCLLRNYLLDVLSRDKELASRFLAPSITIADEDRRFAERLGVSQCTPMEAKALELVSLLRYFDLRKRLLENSLSANTVAEMLGVSRQTPHDRVRNGQLLGIMDHNVMKFPAWQFDPEGPNGVIVGLPEVLSALNCSPLAKISWLTKPNAIFAGLTPIEMLKQNRQAEVLHEAQAVEAF